MFSVRDMTPHSWLQDITTTRRNSTASPYSFLLIWNIQGEHKNAPWFQVVIKLKLTGIFLQKWWLQLHKLIQFHVVSHTLNVPPSCYSANIDAIIPVAAQKRFSDAINNLLRDRLWPECPFLWSQMHPFWMKFLCHFKIDLLVGVIHIKSAFESTLHCYNTVCFMKFQHAPAALLWSERQVAFHCPLAAGGKSKNFLS